VKGGLIDSHCHLNADRFEADADQVIGAARLAGLERVLVPGWNVASSERALVCVDRFPWLDAAVGVHPHDAAKVDNAGWARVVGWATDPRVVAIGETGLDYDRVFSPIADLSAQIEAARLLTHRAALEKDAGQSFTLTAAQAKLITGRLAVRATEEAVQIHGGYGYIEEYPVCRFYRDAKILTIGEGTDEVQQMVIARALGA
jgi:alkylation response protein AidB-like acyl-CoA dehydrogenase